MFASNAAKQLIFLYFQAVATDMYNGNIRSSIDRLIMQP
jgi:hypothetical protein